MLNKIFLVMATVVVVFGSPVNVSAGHVWGHSPCDPGINGITCTSQGSWCIEPNSGYRCADASEASLYCDTSPGGRYATSNYCPTGCTCGAYRARTDSNACGVNNCILVESCIQTPTNTPPPVSTPPPGATPTPTPQGPTCPASPDAQFFTKTTAGQSPTNWFPGSAITSLNPSRPFYLDVNCFANGGSTLFNGATIQLSGPGLPNGTGTFNGPEARDIRIDQLGVYTARCVDNSIANCENTDSFTLVAPGVTVTPTPIPTVTNTPTPPPPTPTPTPFCQISNLTVSPSTIGVGGTGVLSFALSQGFSSVNLGLSVSPTGIVSPCTSLVNAFGAVWTCNLQAVAPGSANITVTGVNAGTNPLCSASVGVVVSSSTPTPTPPGNPTPTPPANQCQQIIIERNGQPISASQIRKGDTIKFVGFANGSGVTAIRFVVTKNGVAGAGVDVPVTELAPNSYRAELTSTIDAARYSVAISPVTQ